MLVWFASPPKCVRLEKLSAPTLQRAAVCSQNNNSLISYEPGKRTKPNNRTTYNVGIKAHRAEFDRKNLLAVGSEAMRQSSDVYAQVKLNARPNPAMKAPADQLALRYKAIGAGRKKKSSPNA